MAKEDEAMINQGLNWHPTVSKNTQIAYTKPDEGGNIVTAHMRNLKTGGVHEVDVLVFSEEQVEGIRATNV